MILSQFVLLESNADLSSVVKVKQSTISKKMMMKKDERLFLFFKCYKKEHESHCCLVLTV